MSILKKYFETEAGQVRPSKSIRTLARISYWVYLVLGAVAAAGCLFAFIGSLFHTYTMDMAILYLLLSVISPLFCKLLGWMSSLSLRAIAVVVESHEKNLDRQSEGVVVRPATWTCKSCGSVNPQNVVTCANCGGMKEDRTEAMQAALAEKFTAVKGKAAAATERVTATSEKVVSAARKFFDSKSKNETAQRSDGWTCAQCGTNNPAFVGSCKQCGAVKVKTGATEKVTAKPKKESTNKMEGWNCAQCGANNPAFVGSCNKCGAVKPKK